MKFLNAAQIWIACHGIHFETDRSSLTSDVDLIAFAQAERFPFWFYKKLLQ
ncbi:hypothetical protein [Desulfosarcina sp.]|uniref:hypothetical protein n=1 Tax=Desulfosarcina sp. TaxID=2027861 RepID=UPI0029A91421|nr:hypothetical protein [Desulfosarcina sp.]MDX2451300.1 hypothetical protein [Desulfosarcina sp.]MDX2489123.1 hypothetical protein [Desulfosarcina sp.]